MDLNIKIPRGLDTGLILPARRRGGEGSPELGPDGKPLPHTRSGRAGATDVNPALAVATDPSGFDEVRRKGTLLWEKLTSVKDTHLETPRLLHTAFMRLPSRSEFPDYYNLIKKPVAFNEIWQKLERLEYSSIVEVRNDFNQCFVNAKRYNAPGSGIFLDAKKLHKVLKQWYAHITGEAEAPEDDDAPAPMPQPIIYSQPSYQQSPPRFDYQQNIPVGDYGMDIDSPGGGYNAEAGPSVVVALPAEIPGTTFAKRGPTMKPWLTKKLAETTALLEVNTGRKISDSFKTLPDKKEWAEYYKVIERPMSFDTITTKVTKRAYTAVQQFVDDVNLIFSNAQSFNEERSRIWSDAELLKRHFASVMQEVPPAFIPPRKYNTAKRRAEADALARGETLPSAKKKKVAAPRAGTPQGGRAMSESEPPEDFDPDGDSENDVYDPEGSVGPSAAQLLPLPYPPQQEGAGDPFNLPLLPKIEEPEDPFAIPGGTATGSGRSPSGTPGLVNDLPPLPTLPALPSPGPASPYQQSYPYGAPSPYEVDTPPPIPLPQPTPQLSNVDIGQPKMIARMSVEGGSHSVTHFVVHTSPSTAPLTLRHDKVHQHSFSVPSAVTRVDFIPFFRPSPPPSPAKGKARGSTQPAQPNVKTSVRPAGISLEAIPELSSEEGASTHRYALVPKIGLNVVEFVVQPRGVGEEGAECYRCFVTKG